MLLNLNKQSWMDSMQLESFSKRACGNKNTMEAMLKLAKSYRKVRVWLY